MANADGKFRIAVRKFPPFEAAMQKFWDKFCEQSGCSLQAELVPLDLHQLHEATLEKQGLATGDWDVAHINTDWIFEAYTSSAVESLNTYIQNNPPEGYPSAWSKSLLGMQQFNGNIVGLPFHDGPECLIYRKDLFEDPSEQEAYQKAFGKALAPPESWEEFQQIAQFFNRPEQNLYGTVFAGYPDGHNTVFDFCLQLWTRNGYLLNSKGNVQINTPAAMKGLEFYREIFRDKTAVHPGSSEFESVAAGAAFARGEVAMMVNWFGFASVCEVSEDSKVKGKVDVTTLPKGAYSDSASLNVYWLYTIGSGSQHKQVAYDFIRFATNAENDKLLTLEGGIGCRISTWKDQEINKLVPYYHKLEMLHECAKSLPQKSNWTTIASIIDEAVLKAINTELPAETILNEAQEKINQTDE
ncbi:sugar ABC transporter substrate-binding protein [Pedobacter sp. SYSU D00535]|uniref:ABC transporter substrate-binding protein n=1 Tax=Pedobacter sp. SYSU D00535 TaxID=2810308 RepID=UPI001A96A660|nr:sugar ABC transporter substrate-binding protein [Pedobacter sp. SYSU D00535]